MSKTRNTFNVKNLASRITRAIARGTTRSALLVQGTARNKILRDKKSGKLYKRGKRFHRASAPLEPPANDTGNLQRSIKVVNATPGVFVTAKVEADAKYAKALEYGTRKAGRNRKVYIAERPFMRPALKENIDKIKKIIDDELDEAIRGVK